MRTWDRVAVRFDVGPVSGLPGVRDAAFVHLPASTDVKMTGRREGRKLETVGRSAIRRACVDDLSGDSPGSLALCVLQGRLCRCKNLVLALSR